MRKCNSKYGLWCVFIAVVFSNFLIFVSAMPKKWPNFSARIARNLGFVIPFFALVKRFDF